MGTTVMMVMMEAPVTRSVGQTSITATGVGRVDDVAVPMGLVRVAMTSMRVAVTTMKMTMPGVVMVMVVVRWLTRGRGASRVVMVEVGGADGWGSVVDVMVVVMGMRMWNPMTSSGGS